MYTLRLYARRESDGERVRETHQSSNISRRLGVPYGDWTSFSWVIRSISPRSRDFNMLASSLALSLPRLSRSTQCFDRLRPTEYLTRISHATCAYISSSLSKRTSSRAHGSSVTGLSPLSAGGTYFHTVESHGSRFVRLALTRSSRWRRWNSKADES